MKSLHFKFILLLSLSIVLNYTLAAKTIAQHLIESELSNTKLQVDTSQPHILPHQAKALTQIVENTMPIKTIEIKLVELTDNQGLVYLGGIVDKAIVELYLTQMKALLNEDFIDYRQHQIARDHGQFHITLVNPYEYQTIAKNNFSLATAFTVKLHGLGRVEKDNSATYFVVASSESAQRFRQSLLLKSKDFHVTLGFNPQDIYSERKGLDTLIE
ncbi:MAG: hypothetical protein ACPG46_00790 [Thalassotalea sp.]